MEHSHAGPKANAKAVFDLAVDIESPDEREGYLKEACGNDIELRKRVDALLEAYEQAGSFLECPPPGLEVTQSQPLAEGPGMLIGPYKLMEQIGEGGMGVVYVAEQRQPVRRKVALKIIKPGMDTREVIARFEAERQALALMDHPNIAKVFDAGATESGRPYFVMELVRGIPITEYCDQNKLTHRGAAGAVRYGLPSSQTRTSEGHHPPRRQAVERDGHAARRQARSPRSSTSAWPRRSTSD